MRLIATFGVEIPELAGYRSDIEEAIAEEDGPTLLRSIAESGQSIGIIEVEVVD